MRNKANRLARRAGFTLIELLVVIAIVAVIAAILFPVFATVRERGRRTVCQSNLHQIALAMQQYVQDNEGTYPPPYIWETAAYSYLKNVDVFRCPDHPTNVATGQFSTDPTIISADPPIIWLNSPIPVDYEYNRLRLAILLPPYPSKKIRGVQENTLATPSTISLNMDTGWADADGISHNSRTVLKTSCGRGFGGSTLHSGAGNYSYVDGHVKWLTPEEAGEVECANGPLPAPFKD